MTRLIRPATALVAGLAMWASFPPSNLWFLAVVSLGLLAVVLGTGDVRAGEGAVAGLLFGLGFFVPLLPWIGEYVGPLPWLALAGALAVYTALFGAIATVTMRLPLPPLWFAASWTLVETLRSMFPFGGFPWGRTAFSQVDGPLLPLASLVGATGLSFGVALFGAAVAWAFVLGVRAWRRGPRPANEEPHVLSAGVVTAVVTVLLALAAPLLASLVTPATVDRVLSPTTLRIAVVQGNVPRLGLDFNAQRRAVLDYHVRETKLLAAEIASGRVQAPDFVVWPENASDISPLTNPDAAAEIDGAARAVNAPIVLGTILTNGDGQPTNSVLVWDPERGIVDRYDKHIIQPFGEYLPWRGFFRLFSSYADMAGTFEPGHGPSVVRIPTRSGPVVAGVATCWEVAFDRAAKSSVDQGAQVLIVPTNNATFGRTSMTYQQLAMSQVRAIEHGRTVLVAATSGVSAIVSPDGTIASRTELFEPATLTDRVPLRTERTLATRLGTIPTVVVCAAGVAALLAALATRTRFSRSRTRAERRPQQPGSQVSEPIRVGEPKEHDE
ncbi:apolipoprotein N-acyltransferase [Gordonia araii NBRC 100433]|uniref:Apolipoprotein N-acyltransferase n=1 Tax=Gordonia araii NBRC 100433 TaxID=1073574 RepID=G7H5X0_9ACTN|nr:apolipoprotein N-acyltransferase [Gordonia araii]NNG95679.1 apolipoprotein N-acyltransferase [Gordonia araii NBRC 100433]GAB11245.1 apolipoprotein N-acyltransferase [Gordonia araii NBRC 100433]